jgi:hypothetical protein
MAAMVDPQLTEVLLVMTDNCLDTPGSHWLSLILTDRSVG